MADKAMMNVQDTVRLPVYDLDNYNQSAERLNAEQQYINCYPIVTTNQVTGEKMSSLYKRPGHTLALTLAPTIASYGASGLDGMSCLANMAMTQVSDVHVCAMFDGANILIIQYRPAAGTTVLIGTIASLGTNNLNDMVFITEITDTNSLTPSIVVNRTAFDKSISNTYYAHTTASVFTTASLTAIVAASFPSNTPAKVVIGPVQFLNQITYVYCTDGTIAGSGRTALGNPDITSWNTLTQVFSSQYPDNGIALARFKNYILAFGSSSVEFFYDAGNPPPSSALNRTDQAFIKFGCPSPKLVLNVDDQLYWISYSDSDTCGLWTLNGLVPTKLTTEKQDKILNQILSFSGVAFRSSISLDCLLLNGKKHLIINGLGDGGAQQTSQPSLSSAGDTFPLTGTEGHASILAYNITDNVWWGLEFNNNIITGAIVSSTAYPNTLTGNQYYQYCFRRGYQATGNTECSPTFPTAFDNSYATGMFYDVNPSSAVRTVEPVTMSWNLNVIWLGNEKRKRINKIKIVADPVTISDGNIYSVYFSYGRDSTTGACRRVVMPTPHYRCYVSNCGAGRQINLSFMFKSKCDWHVMGVELDVDQGNH